MRLPENHVDREWAEDRIEAFVDGLLSWPERRRFEKIMASDESLADEVAVATRLRDALHSLDRPECPPHVQSAIDQALGRERSVSRFGDDRWAIRVVLQKRRVARLALATVMVVVVVVGAMALWRTNSQSEPPPDDVQLALHDVKLALSYVSLAANETGHTLRTEVVGRNVIVPIRRALDYAEVSGRPEGGSLPPETEPEIENSDQQ